MDQRLFDKEIVKRQSSAAYRFWLCVEKAVKLYEELDYPKTDVILGRHQALYTLQVLAAECRLQDIASYVSQEYLETCMRQVQSDRRGFSLFQNKTQQVYRYLEAKIGIARASSYLDTRVQIRDTEKILDLIQDNFYLSQPSDLSKDNVHLYLQEDPQVVRTDYLSDTVYTSFEVSYLSDTLFSHLPVFNYWQALLLFKNETIATLATRQLGLERICQ